MRITLKLYATLTDYLPPSARADNRTPLELPDGASIEQALSPFGLPPKLTHLVLVNGVFVPREARATHGLREGDVLAVWPPIAGG